MLPNWVITVDFKSTNSKTPRTLCLHDPFDGHYPAVAIQRHTVAGWQWKLVNRTHLPYCSNVSFQTLLDRKFGPSLGDAHDMRNIRDPGVITESAAKLSLSLIYINTRSWTVTCLSPWWEPLCGQMHISDGNRALALHIPPLKQRR